MVVDAFMLFSFYSVIDITDPTLDFKGNSWRQQHVEQGFAWRPGCVAFGLLHDVGEHVVEVLRANDLRLKGDAKRAIVVPFAVPPIGQVVVSDLITDRTIALPPGKYALLFETGHGATQAYWIQLTFVPALSAEPAILHIDSSLAPTYPLLMDAEPA